jgi:hypothetical protein
MTSDIGFEIAGGSVAGRDHRNALRNSHDAFHYAVRPGILVGVVCDGCGSSEHSEVGAKIGARMFVDHVLRRYQNNPKSFDLLAVERELEKIRLSMLGQIQVLADSMGGSFSETISDCFLFTILAVIITREWAFAVSAGDGVICMNDRWNTLDSQENKPEYLAYGLVETDLGHVPSFKLLHGYETWCTQEVLIGTDGVKDLMKAAEKNIPGKDEKVGPIDQFWKDDKYFKNPFAIQRRLNLVNRTSCRIDYEKKVVHEEHGHLPDDTTLVVVRRKKA